MNYVYSWADMFATKWTGFAALGAGFAAAIAALVVATGSQLAGSPSAMASTSRPTPFQNPIFAPIPAPKPPSSVGSNRSAGDADWISKALPAYGDVQAGIQRVAESLNAQDIDGTKAACQRLGEAGQRLGAALPSTLSPLSRELSVAVDDVRAGTSACGSLGTDPEGAQAVVGPLQRAMDHLSKAGLIVQSGGN
jgi:hypothetical protein